MLNCIQKLQDFSILFLHKESIKLENLYAALGLLPSQSLQFRAQALGDNWLQSIEAYNALLFQGWFYRLFDNWSHMLIFQLDAWVLGSGQDLARWIDRNYTYVGAPWTNHLGTDTPDIGVGNGGFSLRKVSDMIRICDSFKTSRVPVFRWRELAYRMTLFRRYQFFPKSQWPLIFLKRCCLFATMSLGWHNTLSYYAAIGIQEDHLISIYAPWVFPWMRIPAMAEAASFSVETNPQQTFAFYHIQRPFGCHAWEKHNRDFWLASFPEEFAPAMAQADPP